jgi:hypothetical protein
MLYSLLVDGTMMMVNDGKEDCLMVTRSVGIVQYE